MRIGYARVSSEDQKLDLQLNALKEAGCERTFTDKLTGKVNDRPGLKEAISHLRKDDVLVVWKLDRLGRSVKNLIEIVERLEAKGIQFQSITDKIDTSTPSGKFFFHMMAALSQMERELIVERTQAGLKAARDRGIVGGRKRSMTTSKMDAAKKLIEAGTPAKEVAKTIGVSIPTLYRWLPASERPMPVH